MTLKEILNSKIALYLIVGALALVTFNIFRANVELQKENKALQATNKIQDKQLEEMKAENQLQFEKIAEAIHFQDEHLADLSKAYTDLIVKYEEIENSLPDEETDIRNITDVDSLYREIARHYRR